LQQVLVHPNGAFELTPATEQVAQRKVQIGGVGIVLDGLDEGIDGFVLLLVEQQVQALEIGARRITAVATELPQIEARAQPAQRKGHRQSDQQPLKVEVHQSRFTGAVMVTAAGLATAPRGGLTFTSPRAVDVRARIRTGRAEHWGVP
jgi:hypothetical protein